MKNRNTTYLYGGRPIPAGKSQSYDTQVARIPQTRWMLFFLSLVGSPQTVKAEFCPTFTSSHYLQWNFCTVFAQGQTRHRLKGRKLFNCCSTENSEKQDEPSIARSHSPWKNLVTVFPPYDSMPGFSSLSQWIGQFSEFSSSHFGNKEYKQITLELICRKFVASKNKSWITIYIGYWLCLDMLIQSKSTRQIVSTILSFEYQGSSV